MKGRRERHAAAWAKKARQREMVTAFLVEHPERVRRLPQQVAVREDRLNVHDPLELLHQGVSPDWDYVSAME